jgi:hypothetical protein
MNESIKNDSIMKYPLMNDPIMKYPLNNKPIMKYPLKNEPKSRTVLAPLYIRKLIDENYKKSTNYEDYVSLEGIAVRLQLKYSLRITTEMVLQAMILEPAYTINYYYSTAGCRFIKYNY